MRQARSCKQIAFIIQLAKKEETEEEKKAKYAKLNDKAIEKLRKHKGQEEWERIWWTRWNTRWTGMRTSC